MAFVLHAATYGFYGGAASELAPHDAEDDAILIRDQDAGRLRRIVAIW